MKNPDSLNARLTVLAKKYEGFVQSMSLDKTVIRVKSNHLEDAVAEICTLGNVSQKDIRGEDVSEQYEDLQIRLESAIAARQRYLELLARAENVEAGLSVEQQIERLNKEIDGLMSKLNQLRNLNDYSTITINIERIIIPGPLGYIGLGLYYSVKWLFVLN